MNMIYLIGWTTKEFEGGTTTQGCIKVKRNIGKTYDYFTLVAFKDLADDCRKIKSGCKVAVEGTLQANMFQNTKYYSIIVNDIRVIEQPKAEKEEIKEKPTPVNDDLDYTDLTDNTNEDLPF